MRKAWQKLPVMIYKEGERPTSLSFVEKKSKFTPGFHLYRHWGSMNPVQSLEKGVSMQLLHSLNFFFKWEELRVWRFWNGLFWSNWWSVNVEILKQIFAMEVILRNRIFVLLVACSCGMNALRNACTVVQFQYRATILSNVQYSLTIFSYKC